MYNHYDNCGCEDCKAERYQQELESEYAQGYDDGLAVCADLREKYRDIEHKLAVAQVINQSLESRNIILRGELEEISRAYSDMMAEYKDLRGALERIAYQHGSPDENVDYLAGIASEALQRTGGGE